MGQRLDCVWDAETCDVTIKKKILRLLVEEVLVDIDKARDAIDSWIHFKGGRHVPCAPHGARRGHSQKMEAKAAIGALRAVCDDARWRGSSTAMGCPAAKLVGRQARSAHCAKVTASRPSMQRRNSNAGCCLEKAAAVLGISPMSVHRLAQQGILPAEQPAPGMPCIIRRTDLALPEVRQAVHRILSTLPRPLPADPDQLKLF